MSFKIVSTIEKGDCMVSAVPSMWERNGILLWPPTNRKIQFEELRQDKFSKPSNNWIKYECQLKASNIKWKLFF